MCTAARYALLELQRKCADELNSRLSATQCVDGDVNS